MSTCHLTRNQRTQSEVPNQEPSGHYRVTGNLYITAIFFPRINFGVTLHFLYRKYFSAEVILLYMTGS